MSKESSLKGKVVLAVSFLPKELETELEELPEDVVLGDGKRLWWLKSLEKAGPYFDEKLGHFSWPGCFFLLTIRKQKDIQSKGMREKSCRCTSKQFF